MQRASSNPSIAPSATVFAGRAAAIVTVPIAKKALYDAGFRYPGHTEYLAHLASSRTGKALTAVMMLAGPALRTVPVTIHIPLVRGAGSAYDGADRHHRAHRGERSRASASASPGRGWPSPASIRMPAKTARSAARTMLSSRPAVAALRAGRHRRLRPPPRRHDVP